MKMYRSLVSLVVAAVLLLSGRQAWARLKVIATTPDLAAIARQVGGDRIEVTSLSLPTQDPHFVDAKPSLALALNRADLLLVQGLDLEIGWLPTLQTGARNPKILTGANGYLDCSSFIAVLEAPSGQVSRAQGDIHRGGNPHYLYDPRNGAKVAGGIAERLSRLDPEMASQYAKNAEEFERAAKDVAASLASRFTKLEPAKRKIIVYHRSWVYLENWLGLTEMGAVEPKPGIPPDPAHVAELMVLMRAEAVRAIVSEAFYPETTTELLAHKSGATLVLLPGGTADNENYLDHIKDVAGRIYGALSR
jgi:zinc/manganese transport system substrate-binding protein